MVVKEIQYYTIELTKKEVDDLVTAIEDIYGMYAVANKLDNISTLLDLKDAIVLSANKG